MKKFFKEIGNSVYNPQFYGNLAGMPKSFSWSYFFKLCFTVSVIFSIIGTLMILPGILAISNGKLFTKIIQEFPAELTVTINKGVVSTNVVEPYAVQISDEIKTLSGHKNTDKSVSNANNFVVIDTASDPTISEFEKYETVVLITKNRIFVKDESKGKVSIQSLEKFPDASVNRETITSVWNKISPFLWILTPLFMAGIFLAGVFGFMGYHLSSLLIIALIIFIIIRLSKRRGSYFEMYRVGLHAITPSVVGNLILWPFGVSIPWLAYFLVVLLTVFLNLRKGALDYQIETPQAGA